MPISTMSKLILAFVTLIVGAVLITSAATQGNLVTDKYIVTDEVVDYTDKMTVIGGEVDAAEPNQTVANAPSGWKTHDCPLTSVVVANNSNVSYTENTDYKFYPATGILEMLNTTATNSSNQDGLNRSLVDYVYCQDGYMNLAWGRTGIDTAMGLFAIGILGASIGLFYSVGKDYGFW